MKRARVPKAPALGHSEPLASVHTGEAGGSPRLGSLFRG